MTNHIVNFAIGIDDDAIIKNITKNAEQQIIKELKRDVINSLFKSDKYYRREITFKDNGDVQNATELTLSPISEEIVKKVIEDSKDLIINKAAEMLADSFKRTKVWKEKAGKVIE